MTEFEKLHVVPDSLERLSRELESNINDIKNIDKQIRNDVIPRLDNYWSGKSKECFVARYLCLQDQFTQITSLFDELIQDLTLGSKKYNDSDDQVKSINFLK